MNAASIAAFSARAAATGAALWPGLVLIAGVEYAATLPEPKNVSGELIEGGEQSLGQLIARVSVDILPTKPAAQQALRWKRPGETAWRPIAWWIDEVEKSPLDTEWRILCSPKN